MVQKFEENEYFQIDTFKISFNDLEKTPANATLFGCN